MSTVVPTTELEAINKMLRGIGESPVNSLGGASNADVDLAQQTLLEVSRAVQSEGFAFNTEYNYTLSRNQDSEIPVPANTLRVDADGSGYDVVLRAGKLYDRTNSRYTFPNTASLKVQIIVALPFEELPECARYYIMVRAAREFQGDSVGSDTLDGFKKRDEARARAILMAEEGDTGDHTIFDSASVFYAINRPARRYQ